MQFKTAKSVLKLSVCTVVLGMTLNCAPIANVHGNMLEAEDVQQIESGITTKNEILSQFGSPSTTDAFDNSTWIYIGKKTEHFAFFQPDIQDQKILVVQFDEEDIVNSIKLYNQNDILNVNLDDEETPTAGDDITILQQLLGNIGRFQGDSSKNLPGSTDR